MIADILFTPAVLLTSFAIAGSMCGILFYLRLRKMREIFRNIPMIGEYSPFFGNMMEIPKKASAQYTYFLSWLQKHRRMVTMWVGPFRPYVYVFHPDLAKTVLQNNDNRPAEDGDVYAMLRPWTGDGLLVANGKQWERNRRLLTSAFHNDILRPYLDVFNKTTDILLENVDKMAETGQSFDIYPLLQLVAFDSVLKCALSLDLDVQRQKDVPYLKSCKKLANLWGERMTNILEYWDLIYQLTPNGREFKKQCDFVHTFTDGLIDSRRQLLKTKGLTNKPYIDFMDILLTAEDDTGSGLTRAEIRAEIDTLLFAGHETTSTCISWLLHYLSQHLEYQHRVQNEIDSLLTERGSADILWNCIGQVFAANEVKVVTAKLLQRFELTPDPTHPVVPVLSSIIHSETGMWVYAKRRE